MNLLTLNKSLPAAKIPITAIWLLTPCPGFERILLFYLPGKQNLWSLILLKA